MKAVRYLAVVGALVLAIGAALVFCDQTGQQQGVAATSTVQTPRQGASATRVPTSAKSPSSAESAGSTDLVDVCGRGMVTSHEAMVASAMDFAPDLPVVAHTAGLLESSSVLEVQALGTWLPFINASARASSPYIARLVECGDKAECQARVTAQLVEAKEKAGDPGAQAQALARLASTTTSPGVYAMAVQACRAFDTTRAMTGHCQAISIRRWAQLDPRNAMPWLHLAAAADLRGDISTLNDALYQASIAQSSRLYSDSLLAYAEAALGSLRETDRDRIATELLNVQGEWAFPSFSPVLKQCGEVDIRNANIRQVCDAFASTLIDKGRTLLELSVGTRLAGRLGWSAERMDALSRVQTSVRAGIQMSGAAESRLTCSAMKRSFEQAFEISRLGEVGAARAAITRSSDPSFEGQTR